MMAMSPYIWLSPLKSGCQVQWNLAAKSFLMDTGTMNAWAGKIKNCAYLHLMPKSYYMNSFITCFYSQRYPPDADDCNEMLFYPDWAGSNEGCANDGKCVEYPVTKLSASTYHFAHVHTPSLHTHTLYRTRALLHAW